MALSHRHCLTVPPYITEHAGRAQGAVHNAHRSRMLNGRGTMHYPPMPPPPPPVTPQIAQSTACPSCKQPTPKCILVQHTPSTAQGTPCCWLQTPQSPGPGVGLGVGGWGCTKVKETERNGPFHPPGAVRLVNMGQQHSMRAACGASDLRVGCVPSARALRASTPPPPPARDLCRDSLCGPDPQADSCGGAAVVLGRLVQCLRTKACRCGTWALAAARQAV